MRENIPLEAVSTTILFQASEIINFPIYHQTKQKKEAEILEIMETNEGENALPWICKHKMRRLTALFC